LRILAGTNNVHKILEFKSILQDSGTMIVSPPELGISLPDIPEDGSTFEENAGIKALGFAKFAKMTVIADDSGLEIDALGGAPGIHSARYAGTNEKRIERVLREIEEKCQVKKSNSQHRTSNIEHRSESINQRSKIKNADDRRPFDYVQGGLMTDNRTARFVCVVALAEPGKVIATFRGEVRGRLGYEARGAGGFGYDPIFIPDGYEKTFAELGGEIKDKISHRANALKKLEKYLKGGKIS